MPPKIACFVVFFIPSLLPAQQKSDFQQILDRLERIEQENQALAGEVRALRAELAASRSPAAPAAPPATEASGAATAVSAATSPPPPPLDEQVEVNTRRIAEQAQSKVEASQKLPITLTGMVLFNAFLNGRANGGAEYPIVAAPGDNPAQAGGATISQSVIGLKFQGPQVLGGGQISGSIYADGWGGTPNNSLNHLLRLRTATVEIDWKNTTILAGQDKPIVSPREPNSLAQVAVSPLTGAGNLWLWSPQVRIEQRFAFDQRSGLIAQAGVYETSEPSYSARGGDELGLPSLPRPAIEGRFEFWRKLGEGSRLEIAPGFHASTTHAGGFSAPSRLATIDWLIQPVSKLQFTGMFFTGENAAGLGGLHQGFSIVDDIRAVSIGANGGWSQLSYLATTRLTFNFFAGEENDRLADLLPGDIHRNLLYGGNAIYRLGSNVLLGAEVSQVRTNYYLLPSRLNNHYDLSLGYLF
jgi:hypothetical protein